VPSNSSAVGIPARVIPRKTANPTVNEKMKTEESGEGRGVRAGSL